MYSLTCFSAPLNLQVITPSAGGPAEKAGVEPRDVLLAIGERVVDNISLYEAGDLLQGTEGTEVSTKPETCLSPQLMQSIYVRYLLEWSVEYQQDVRGARNKQKPSCSPRCRCY